LGKTGKISGKKFASLCCLVLVLALVLALYSAGCKGAASTETTAAAAVTEGNESEETSSGTEETASGTEETAAETANPDEIKGNINPLSGLELSDKVANLRPLAVMVENNTPARPQSGLVSADVVFEVVDEGGITRFVTIYSSYDSDMVGPVRSARPYYAEIAASFNPIYTFWGTFPGFYIVIQNLGLDYLSPLGDETGASNITGNFVDPGSGAGADAIRDTTRVAPHNAYIQTPRMREIAANIGYASEPGETYFHFKEDAGESSRGDIGNITVDFSSSSFRVDWEYDEATNTYLRSVGGEANLDRETGKQVTVNNVIVLFTDIENSGNEQGHMLVRTTQGGDAYFFIDGQVIEGTWDRSSALEPFQFKDMDGNVMLINRGQTWISMISGIEQLSY
jgi:hypothetical protein